MEVLVVPAEPDEPDGPEVVRKTAGDPEERERLLREADVLRAAAELGVPGLPEVITAPTSGCAVACLVTAAAAGPSLAVAAPLPVLEVAGVAAEVARLLAGLHEAGLVHGAVGPSHVVLDGAGGAILVGLGDGGPIGASSNDPASGPLDPADDVAGWGALVGHLLDWSATAEDEPLTALRRSLADRRPRRRGPSSAPSRHGEHERRVLAAIADQAQDPDPARRPSSRALAAAVTHRIPGALVPGAVPALTAARATGLLDRLAAHVVTSGAGPPPPASPSPPNGRPPARPPSAPSTARRRWRAPAVDPPRAGTHGPDPAPSTSAAPGAAAGHRRQPGLRRPRQPPEAPLHVPSATEERRAVVDDGQEAGRPDDGHNPRARAAGHLWPRHWVAPAAAAVLLVLAVAVADRPMGSAPPPTTAGRAAGCAATASPAADIDGDGCEEPITWSDGILQAGSARFALGRPGDAWAVGDWDCDGRRTPALLHQGSLAVFDSWPEPGAELQGRVVGTADGATAITVVPGPDGCDRPSAIAPAGVAPTIPVAAP
jgi:hypothetical protein